MISKEDLLKMLSLPADADLSAVREKVRGMENRALDAVAAQAVMGLKVEPNMWDTRSCNELTPHYDFGVIGSHGTCHEHVDYYTENLNSAAALMPKIEEMGLKSDFVLRIFNITGCGVGPMDNDDWKLINATARQRTEASVLAVAGRVMQ